MGLRVGLLDADIYGPSAPRMMGVDGEPSLRGRQAAAAGSPRHQDHVDRLPGRRGQGDDLARADGLVGGAPDDQRRGLGQ
jgi:hypothetical protein